MRRKIRHFSASLPAKSRIPISVRNIPWRIRRSARRPSASPAERSRSQFTCAVRSRSPGTLQRIAAAAAARVHGERPLGSRERVVEDPRRVAVVERDDRAPDERPGERPMERLGVRRDLGLLAGLEHDAEPRRDARATPRAPARRSRRSDRPRRPPAAPGARPRRPRPARPAGRRRARSRRSIPRIDPASSSPALSRMRGSGSMPRAAIARRPAGEPSTAVSRRHSWSCGSILAQGAREVFQEAAVARADVHEVHRARSAVGLDREEARERGGERRRRVGRSQEVPALADRRAARVVALGGIVERRLHEVVKGDGALAGDALKEPLGQ